MSLAEDHPRSYLGSLTRAPQKLSRLSLADLALRSTTAETKPLGARPAEPQDHDEPSVVPLPRRVDRPTPKPESSLDVIDRASKGVAMILARYKQLEEHVKQIDSWSEARIEAAETEATRWQETATVAEKRLEECQRSLEIMVRRAEAAEQAMLRDKQTLEVLQDRIVEAFGFGSDAHEAIAAGLQLG